MIFAGVTRAVECGFIAAGVTVAVVAAIQSISILVGWLSTL
jgi:Flp pilus assembly pilin Flp